MWRSLRPAPAFKRYRHLAFEADDDDLIQEMMQTGG